ncbi:MAG: GNAT family N-acetyltransferase [Clostridium celatum]|nr:GNAT family N-acetyltransferase [Clostridium celatum]
MEKYRIIKIQEQPELRNSVANWFHEKWDIPIEAYLESINECIRNESTIPQWYIALSDDKIVGGLGVIENDFHNRKDLSPNVCALYVEEEYRCQGIAGNMLDYVCKDMKEKNVDTLYLITDHSSFYERYGWEFLCMVQGDGEEELTRMYIHREI